MRRDAALLLRDELIEPHLHRVVRGDREAEFRRAVQRELPVIGRISESDPLVFKHGRGGIRKDAEIDQRGGRLACGLHVAPIVAVVALVEELAAAVHRHVVERLDAVLLRSVRGLHHQVILARFEQQRLLGVHVARRLQNGGLHGLHRILRDALLRAGRDLADREFRRIGRIEVEAQLRPVQQRDPGVVGIVAGAHEVAIRLRLALEGLGDGLFLVDLHGSRLRDRDPCGLRERGIDRRTAGLVVQPVVRDVVGPVHQFGFRFRRTRPDIRHFVHRHVGHVPCGVSPAEQHRTVRAEDDRRIIDIPRHAVQRVFLRNGVIAERGGHVHFPVSRGCDVRRSRRLCRRLLVDVRNIARRPLGFIPCRVEAAEIHFAVGDDRDLAGASRPVCTVQRILLPLGIAAECGGHRHDSIGRRRDVRCGCRRCRFLRVDVRDLEADDFGWIPRLVGRLEIDGRVLAHGHACVGIRLPLVVAFSLEFVFPAGDADIVYEIRRDGHILIGRCRDVGPRVRDDWRRGVLGCDRLLLDVGDLVTDGAGFVPGGVRGTEIHFAVLRDFDRRGVAFPHHAVRRVFLHGGIRAEDRCHGHLAAGFGRDVGGSRRLRGRDVVDVRHGEAGHLGNVSDRIRAAEIHGAVVVELDCARIWRPVQSVHRVFVLDRIFCECRGHDHAAVGGRGDVCGRNRCRGCTLFDVGDRVGRPDRGRFVPRRIDGLEGYRRILAHGHAFLAVDEPFAVIDLILNHGDAYVVLEFRRHRDVLIRGLGNIGLDADENRRIIIDHRQRRDGYRKISAGEVQRVVQAADVLRGAHRERVEFLTERVLHGDGLVESHRIFREVVRSLRLHGVDRERIGRRSLDHGKIVQKRRIVRTALGNVEVDDAARFRGNVCAVRKIHVPGQDAVRINEKMAVLVDGRFDRHTALGDLKITSGFDCGVVHLASVGNDQIAILIDRGHIRLATGGNIGQCGSDFSFEGLAAGTNVQQSFIEVGFACHTAVGNIHGSSGVDSRVACHTPGRDIEDAFFVDVHIHCRHAEKDVLRFARHVAVENSFPDRDFEDGAVQLQRVVHAAEFQRFPADRKRADFIAEDGLYRDGLVEARRASGQIIGALFLGCTADYE